MKKQYTTCNGSTFNATHWTVYSDLKCLTVKMNADYSTIAYTYTPAISNAVFTATYAYTPDGLDAGYAIMLTNGVVLSRALTHDLYRRGLIKTVTNTVDSVPVTPLAYSYDLLNRVTNRNADSFGYNVRSEVTSASILSNAYTFSYDNIGNHTTSSVDSVVSTYTANQLNQYTAILRAPVPPCEPSYDLDGNMLTNGVWSYSYDSENRLTVAFSNSVCVVSNAYDYMSRRVLKISHGGTETRRFVYDGWLPIVEIVATSSTTATNSYIWGKDLSGSFQGAGGVGGLLAVKQGNAWYFPFYDANGNITAYVDENGSIVAEYVYDAFGETIAKSGSMADAFSFRFSTKYFDAETSLYYYGYRFYAPVLHRWLNRDPSGERGGLNVYGFCGNNSINGIDYNGLKWIDITGSSFIIHKTPYFRNIPRPIGLPEYQKGGVDVRSVRWIKGMKGGGVLSGWSSDWRLNVAVSGVGNGCYTVEGDTSLFGTVWSDAGNYLSLSAGRQPISYASHEQHHIDIWTKNWTKYSGYIQQLNPDRRVSRKIAETKVEWIQWSSAVFFACSQIENGKYDFQEYGLYMTREDVDALRYYIGYYNLLLSAQPKHVPGVNVTVDLPRESMDGLPSGTPYQPPDTSDDIGISITW